MGTWAAWGRVVSIATHLHNLGLDRLSEDQEVSAAMTPDEKRAMWREFWRKRALHYAETDRLSAQGVPSHKLPRCPPFPDELRDMTCGARTRAGTPCKRRDLYRSGRCKLHGGLSTGPKTPEGKARAAINGKPKTGEEIETETDPMRCYEKSRFKQGRQEF